MLCGWERAGRLLRLSRGRGRSPHTRLENEATLPPAACQAVMHGDTESIQSAPGRRVKRKKAERYGVDLTPTTAPVQRQRAGLVRKSRRPGTPGCVDAAPGGS